MSTNFSWIDSISQWFQFHFNLDRLVLDIMVSQKFQLIPNLISHAHTNFVHSLIAKQILVYACRCLLRACLFTILILQPNRSLSHGIQSYRWIYDVIFFVHNFASSSLLVCRYACLLTHSSRFWFVAYHVNRMCSEHVRAGNRTALSCCWFGIVFLTSFTTLNFIIGFCVLQISFEIHKNRIHKKIFAFYVHGTIL